MSMFLLSRSELPSICFLSGTELFYIQKQCTDILFFICSYLFFVQSSASKTQWCHLRLVDCHIIQSIGCALWDMFGNIYEHKDKNCISQWSLPSRCCSNTPSLANNSLPQRVLFENSDQALPDYMFESLYCSSVPQALAVVATMGFHPSFTCYVKHHKNSSIVPN